MISEAFLDCLLVIFASGSDAAFSAFGGACDADVSAVEDKPVVGDMYFFCGDVFE